MVLLLEDRKEEMNMKELTKAEVQEVNGGVAPLAALGFIAGSYVLGWIGGYVASKYEQSRPSGKSSGCAPTC
jgi:lactobin A/cerein 7B family class IIb bacteriocin